MAIASGEETFKLFVRV